MNTEIVLNDVEGQREGLRPWKSPDEEMKEKSLGRRSRLSPEDCSLLYTIHIRNAPAVPWTSAEVNVFGKIRSYFFGFS